MAICLPALMASFYAVIFFVVKKYGTTTTQQLLVLWAGLSLVDVLRQWLLSGFPWNIASHSFLYLSFMMPLVSLVGQYVMSFWLYGIIFLCLIYWYLKNNCSLSRWLIGMMIWVLLPLAVGYQLHEKPWPTTLTSDHGGDETRLVLVQPNLSGERQSRQTIPYQQY